MKRVPYVVSYVRLDIVTKVPHWAEPYVQKGDKVLRYERDHVVVPGKGGLKLGESYTKFVGYATEDGKEVKLPE